MFTSHLFPLVFVIIQLSVIYMTAYVQIFRSPEISSALGFNMGSKARMTAYFCLHLSSALVLSLLIVACVLSQKAGLEAWLEALELSACVSLVSAGASIFFDPMSAHDANTL